MALDDGSAERRGRLSEFEELSRYPIADASYKLTESCESPILGYKALREVGRWLGSRNGANHHPRSIWETLTPQRRRGVVLLLAQLALRRIQSPSGREEASE